MPAAANGWLTASVCMGIVTMHTFERRSIVEDAMTSESAKQSPDHLVAPDVWRAFAERFTQLWKEQVEAMEHADIRQRRGVA
jgi:5-methylthioribose kinase